MRCVHKYRGTQHTRLYKLIIIAPIIRFHLFILFPLLLSINRCTKYIMNTETHTQTGA